MHVLLLPSSTRLILYLPELRGVKLENLYSEKSHHQAEQVFFPSLKKEKKNFNASEASKKKLSSSE